MSRLRLWRDGEGQAWRCDAYDHGPMCRQCERLDEMPLWSVVDGALCWKGADRWSAAGLAWALDDEGEGRPTPEDAAALIALIAAATSGRRPE